MSPATNSLATRREFLRAATALALAGVTRPFGAFAAAASDYQLGSYTRPWDQFEYRVALDGIAEAGFKHCGLMTAKGKSWILITVESTPGEVAAIAAEVKQRGLKTLSIYGGDFPVAKSVEAGIAGLKRLIDHCAICACPTLLLGGTTEDKLVAPYDNVVAECCDYAAAKGVGLSIKPHGGSNATGPQCRKRIEQVGHKNFRLWYDPGNIFYYSEGRLDPVEDSATVDGLVVGMSVKDFVPPKEVMVTPGAGRVKFRRVLANLQRGGFTRGPLVVECLARENVMMSCTHTHSADSGCGVHLAEADATYRAWLPGRIADAVRGAVNNLAPAQIAWGSGNVPQHVFGRRLLIKPGMIYTNPLGFTGEKAKMNWDSPHPAAGAIQARCLRNLADAHQPARNQRHPHNARCLPRPAPIQSDHAETLKT